MTALLQDAMQLSILLGLGWAIFLPLIGSYIAYRVLRDLRRIADALESANIQRYARTTPPPQQVAPISGERTATGMLSAFGR